MISLNQKVGLASRSPRRHQLLATLGCTVVPLEGTVDETRADNESVRDYVHRLSVQKARRGGKDECAAGLPVIGGDTVVALGERSFGKPRDEQDAVDMLLALSDRVHQVHTGVALLFEGNVSVEVVTSQVRFARIDQSGARAYWATGEPCGKAGGYAIQGMGARFVAHLDGSHSAVMGLPLFETAQLLDSLPWPRSETK